MGGICITCAFLESSTTDCVAVVHQRISQLGSSGLINIESSHKFTRSGDAAYGCIEGVNLEEYQVGIKGGVRIKECTQTTTNCPSISIYLFIVEILYIMYAKHAGTSKLSYHNVIGLGIGIIDSDIIIIIIIQPLLLLLCRYTKYNYRTSNSNSSLCYHKSKEKEESKFEPR